jgi:hypothetical protein
MAITKGSILVTKWMAQCEFELLAGISSDLMRSPWMKAL